MAPLVSIHHLDVIQPIFPNVNQLKALQRLQLPMKLDSAALMQQSVCYDKRRHWTISVSWGYSVQIVRGILKPREMEIPVRTFLSWYRKADETGFTFNTRNLHKNNCQRSFVYTLSHALHNPINNGTVTQYVYYRNQDHKCPWKMPSPSIIRKVEVLKKPDPFMWDKVSNARVYFLRSFSLFSPLLICTFEKLLRSRVEEETAAEFCHRRRRKVHWCLMWVNAEKAKLWNCKRGFGGEYSYFNCSIVTFLPYVLVNLPNVKVET